jgi:hypothetical protein
MDFSRGGTEVHTTGTDIMLNLEEVYNWSFTRLQQVYETEFVDSNEFIELKQKLFENIIEYEFAMHATLIDKQ